MARPANDDVSDGDGIDLQACALAKRFDADVPRTNATIRRLISELPSLQACRATNAVLEYATGFLRGAFLTLGPSDALTLFESTPFDTLEQRVLISDYLAGAGDMGGVPLYSRRELADQLVVFRAFLTRDQEHSLKTGLPSSEFPECPWLWTRLACLYPVNRTESRWPDDPPESFAGVQSAYRGVRLTTAASGVGLIRTPCRLNEADLIYGLTTINTERLPNMRARIFDLKLAVLEEGERHLRSPARNDYWNRCRSLLHDAGLTADEVEFCIRTDRIYTEVPDKWKQTSRFLTATQGYDGPVQPGGFTSILELIGHVEEECTIGTLHQTREALGDLVITDEDEARQLLCARPPYSYFHIAQTQKDQKTLNRAIDVFRKADEQAFAFWKEFEKRASTITDDLERKVAIQFQAINALAEPLRLQAQSYIEYAKSHLAASGSLPQFRVEPVALLTHGETDQNVFRRSKDLWDIKFETGPMNHFRHVEGLLYLQVLIAKPESGFTPMELSAVKNQSQGKLDKWSISTADDLSVERSGAGESSVSELTAASSAGELLTDEARLKLRDRLKELPTEIEKAREFNDDAAIGRLEAEFEAVLKDLDASVGLGGKPVQQSLEGKRAQNRVQNAINRAIEKIGEKDPALFRHLHNSIEFQPLFSYRPEKPTVWAG